MKNKILSLLLISFFSVLVVFGQNTTKKNNPVGTWKFEAPYAPEQYTKGSIVIGSADKKYTVSVVFDGSENKFAGEKVKFVNDSLFFIMFAEGQDVAVSLKLEDGTKISGKAVYSEGEIPLSLNKIPVVAEGKENTKRQ